MIELHVATAKWGGLIVFALLAGIGVYAYRRYERRRQRRLHELQQRLRLPFHLRGEAFPPAGPAAEFSAARYSADPGLSPAEALLHLLSGALAQTQSQHRIPDLHRLEAARITEVSEAPMRDAAVQSPPATREP